VTTLGYVVSELRRAGPSTKAGDGGIEQAEDYIRLAPDSMAGQDEPAEPRLLVSIDHTPLPEVDRAMPVLSLIPAVVARRNGRYKVALLKTLQADGAGRWRIRQIQEAVFWLEPSAVAELVRELRDSGVLSYDPIRMTYRITSTGRVISALLAALTLPTIEPRRLIKYLSLAMSFALVGGGSSAAKASFASAVAVLRADLEELRRLIDDNSKGALREAAELIEAHVEDMRGLLDEHERFRLENSDDPSFLRLEHGALTLTAELGDAVADVSLWVTGKANEVMRGGVTIDRGDVRDFVAQQTPARLAQLISDLVGRPPFVPFVTANTAFDLLVDKIGRNRAAPPPLPAPATLTRESPPPILDPTTQLVKELRELDGPTSATRFIVQHDWKTSVARHNAFIDAYNRRYSELPALELSSEVDEPRRAGVARISKTTIKVVSK
jgi:DNA-binding HxlR family transcriptional regulator